MPMIIAGGGIGGCAAALALARQGIAAQVLEQAEDFSETGAGIQLGPNVFKMFEVLGISDAVSANAVFPGALVMMDALTGRQITRISLNNDAFKSRFKYPYGVIYRPDLHQVLIDACQASPLVTMHTGCKVTGVADDGARVTVTCDGGRTFAGAGLTGADGLWSKVREQAVGDGQPLVSGHIAYRAVLKADQVPDANRTSDVVLWAGPKTHLVHYPLQGGEIYNLVAVFHSARYEEGWDVFGDTAELDARFAGQHPHVLAMLGKIEAWRMWVLCDREPVDTWSKGRVVLLGDAAHPMLQYLAQGACMATEDAVCLAGHVARARQPGGPPLAEAFAAYARDRYLRCARVQLTARFYGDVYHASGAAGDLRARMLAGRSATAAYDGMNWLYNGVDRNGVQRF